jgi:hypothetical protein
VTWPVLSIEPDLLDFGLSATATQRSRVATIRNDGGADLIVGNITLPAGITVTDGCQDPVAPGGSCQVTIEASIGPESEFSGAMAVESNLRPITLDCCLYRLERDGYIRREGKRGIGTTITILRRPPAGYGAS